MPWSMNHHLWPLSPTKPTIHTMFCCDVAGQILCGWKQKGVRRNQNQWWWFPLCKIWTARNENNPDDIEAWISRPWISRVSGTWKSEIPSNQFGEHNHCAPNQSPECPPPAHSVLQWAGHPQSEHLSGYAHRNLPAQNLNHLLILLGSKNTEEKRKISIQISFNL